MSGAMLAVVPVMPSRECYLPELVQNLSEHGISVQTVRHVDGTSPSDDPPRVFQALAEAPGEWVLHIEDDAIVGPSFAEAIRVLRGINCCGALSFFSLRKREPGLHRVPWSSTVCFAVRPALVVGASDFARDWYLAHPEHKHASDLILRDWFRERRVRHFTYFPSLVQHRDGPSTLGPRSSKRRSPTYVCE